MIVAPEDYQNLDLSSTKKRILAMFRKSLTDEFICLLEINPTGGKENVPFIIIHKTYGLLVITIDDIETPNLEQYVNVMKSIQWCKHERILLNKLGREKLLIDGSDNYILNINWVYFFTNTENPKESIVDSENEIFFKNRCWFKSAFKDIQNDPEFVSRYFNNGLFNTTTPSKCLNNESLNNLGFVLAPYYYIPTKIRIINNEQVLEKRISNNDLEVLKGQRVSNALSLDPEQLNIINNISMGNQLILACAGSGKSVLLLAKAFKFASNYPNKKVLITCFNKNLAQYYNWRIDVAGFSDNNVECGTFHSICAKLLAENNLKNDFDPRSKDYFDNIFLKTQREFYNKNIVPKYDAIFIDEIQIFKKDWYAFCYNLLRNKEREYHMFVICGDKSQNVNDNIKRGIAPWQIDVEGFPDFDTTTVRIEKNYRNSLEINSYINNYVSSVKKAYKDLDITVEGQDDLFLRGQANRPGYEPQVIKSTRYEEVNSVFQTIDDLLEKHDVSLSDIAILLPQRFYKISKYYILKWILDEMSIRNMEHSLLLSDEDYTRYGERNGVSICTIEAALGLDFKAVIICGLYPLGLRNKAYKEAHFSEASSEEELHIRQQSFLKATNQLYTGMTRARDFLYVVLSHKEDNIYSKMLLEAPGEVSQHAKI